MLRTVHEENTKGQPFQVMFLRNDGSRNVEVQELEEIDFMEIEQRLAKGESIFITRKQPAPKPDASRMGTRNSKKTYARRAKSIFFAHL